MRQLNENEIKSIEARVRKKGLNTKKVLSEIVDHVSCAIERKLDEGLDFSRALEEVLAGFGENGIRNIQCENNILRKNKRKRQLWLSTPIAGVLMFTVIVVNASGRPSSRPFQRSLVGVNESFSENINGFLYNVKGKLDIYATANGIVEKIIPVVRKKERKYSIILKHKNGYKTIYANLQTINVAKGDYIEKGKILGKIYSAKEGRRAFFAYKILNSGKPVDAHSYY